MRCVSSSGLTGLVKKSNSAFLQRSHGRIDGPVAGHEDHGGVRQLLLGLAKQGQPVRARHLQVSNDDRHSVMQVPNGLVAIGHGNNAETFALQPLGHRLAASAVIVNQKQGASFVRHWDAAERLAVIA